MVQRNASIVELDHAEIRGYLTWHHPFRALQIYMHPSAARTLQNRVLLGYFAARSSEVGGILLGKILPRRPERCVVIEDLQFVEPTTNLFNTSEADRSRLDIAIREARAGSQLMPVGYFRSHIRPGLCLSPEDQSFIEADLRDPDDVFLIIKPDEIGVCAAAFFFWQRGQLQTELSDLELVSISDESAASEPSVNRPLNAGTSDRAHADERVALEEPVAPTEQRLAAVFGPDAMDGRAAAPSPHANSADALPQDLKPEEIRPEHTKPEDIRPADTRPESETPVNGGNSRTHNAPSTAAPPVLMPERPSVGHHQQTELRQSASNPSLSHPRPAAPDGDGRRSNLLAWALACMLVGALCITGYLALQSGFGRKQGAGSDQAKTDIGLRVEAVPGGQLNVSWNQDMPQLAEMRNAALTIVDGTTRRDLDVDKSQFRFGKLTYVPNSTDVQFQLEVFLPGDRSMAESVRVVVSAPTGGTFEAELAPPRVIETRTPARIEEPKQRSGVDASPRRVTAAPFTAPTSTPVLKRRADSTSLLSGIAAPAVPASPQGDLPLSVSQSFSYVPPKEDVEPAATVEPFQKAQNKESTFIPPPNYGSRSGRVTRIEDTSRSGAARGAETSQAPSPQSIGGQSSPAQGSSLQAQNGSAYTPPVAVREVRPAVPLGLLGLISSEQSVEVLVNIDNRGRVTDSRLVGSKGAISGLLSQSALAAARDYRFKPARHNGVAVASKMTITFRFVR